MGKEFLFGKAMGGVFSEFKLFLFRGVKNSQYSGSRSLHRASQPVFVMGLVLFGLLSLLITWWFAFALAGLLLLRYVYYVLKVFKELRTYVNLAKSLWKETAITALIGVLTDFSYTAGFIYGSILYRLNKKL
jgi:hypothetical protein